MVAPTRTPQARGVKCELCRKILALTTWLDQTKLAKSVEEAQTVLDLINQHRINDCPCIPKSIENLIVGSTHFEVHRIVFKKLDKQACDDQNSYYANKKRTANEKPPTQVINDCQDEQKGSRFKPYVNSDLKHNERSKQQLRHLKMAIDFWQIAMNDQANPFNSKLALRLGLTHHVIYACYLFKYYKLLDYQLITANLLLNLFQAIEGVTANAILHANFLLIKSLIDCDQLHLAKQYLKQATKAPNYREKNNYESILLTCISCELALIDPDGSQNLLEELADLVVIKKDDKLQHYYARTLAMTTIIKYIQCYPSRSDLCFEFYHTFRYIGAIIRRCYEDSFELILSTKDSNRHQQRSSDSSFEQSLDHSWIRFAACDFVFNAFETLADFYTRAGQPECLELLYNGLSLVAYRSGSCYWYTKIIATGIELDLLCDKIIDAESKLSYITQAGNRTNDFQLMNLIRYEEEVTCLLIKYHSRIDICNDTVNNLLDNIQIYQRSQVDRLSQIELYDHKSNIDTKLKLFADPKNRTFFFEGCIGKLTLKAFRITIFQLIRSQNLSGAKTLTTNLAIQLKSLNSRVLEYNLSQILLEVAIQFADVDKSGQFLLEAVNKSDVFLSGKGDIGSIESQLSSLTILSDCDKPDITLSKTGKKRSNKSRISRLPLGRSSHKRGTYEVSNRTCSHVTDIRYYDVIQTIENLSELTREEIVVSYLRNSEPNPDYLFYRQAHELMFCFRLADGNDNQDHLMYHFCESSSSNTMRYRWMQFEEQQLSPYDHLDSKRKSSNMTKYLSFCGAINNIEKTVRTLSRTIGENQKLVQFKYILEESEKLEHLLILCIENKHSPIYIHRQRAISTDDFLDSNFRCDNCSELALPYRFYSTVEESKRTLMSNMNHAARTEARERLETDLKILLHDLEDDWLGPYRFVLCGRICDPHYNTFIQATIDEVQSELNGRSCSSSEGLRWMLENAPLLSREEFCQVIADLFNCSAVSSEARNCFHKWLKSIEAYIREHNPTSNKTTYIQTLRRGQLGLILDGKLELIPLESSPAARIMNQGIFRIPSLRLYSIIAGRLRATPTDLNYSETVYMLDPGNNLLKTRERFEAKLKSQPTWLGTISQPPKTELLEQWLMEKDVYIYIGHGAGTLYYNQLNKGKGLSSMSTVKPVSIIMGCSSGRVVSEGQKLESFGVCWVFVFRGCPTYIGLLWDVTDTDIDKFLDYFLSKWMNDRWSFKSQSAPDTLNTSLAITNALAQARHICQFKFLVGSTPVVYGIPM